MEMEMKRRIASVAVNNLLYAKMRISKMKMIDLMICRRRLSPTRSLTFSISFNLSQQETNQTTPHSDFTMSGFQQAINHFGHNQRRQIIKSIIFILDILIFAYNKLFTATEAILRFISISIFLFVYSITPCIVTIFVMLMSTNLFNISFACLFIAFGIVFFIFFALQMKAIRHFDRQSGLDSLESQLVHLSAANYAKFINYLRKKIISSYRQIGWNVLGLIVSQQIERSHFMKQQLSKTSDIPLDIINIVDSYLIDDELTKLSADRNNNSSSNTARKSTLKPHDIFQIYFNSSSSL
jgi:hypothetical protein